MRAAVLKEFGKPLDAETMAVPQPKHDEVPVRAMAGGLCVSDVRIQGGIAPYVSSHCRLERINKALDSLRACKGLGRGAIIWK